MKKILPISPQFQIWCNFTAIVFPEIYFLLTAEGFRLIPPITAHPHLPAWAGCTVAIPTLPALAWFHQTGESRYCLHWFAAQGSMFTCFRACDAGCSLRQQLTRRLQFPGGIFLPSFTSIPHQPCSQMGSDRPTPWGCTITVPLSRVSGLSKAFRPLWRRSFAFVWATVYVKWEAGLGLWRNPSHGWVPMCCLLLPYNGCGVWVLEHQASLVVAGLKNEKSQLAYCKPVNSKSQLKLNHLVLQKDMK